MESALDIAERGSMKLHECDVHLEWARLCYSTGDLDAARQHLETARTLVASTGYHRRDREVEALTQALADAPSELADEPRRKRDLSDVAGTWKEDTEMDAALEDQRRVDHEDWR